MKENHTRISLENPVSYYCTVLYKNMSKMKNIDYCMKMILFFIFGKLHSFVVLCDISKLVYMLICDQCRFLQGTWYFFSGCGIGYVSKDGFPCMSCLPGRWGRKCGYMCSCQNNERYILHTAWYFKIHNLESVLLNNTVSMFHMKLWTMHFQLCHDTLITYRFVHYDNDAEGSKATRNQTKWHW